MSLTYPQAIDEIFAMFKTAWDAQTTAIVGYIPAVLYPGIESTSVPASGKYFVKADVLPVKERQKTLAVNVDIPTGRRYNNMGIVRFQIMCPLSDVRNAEKGVDLGILVRNAFRGKESPCGIVFHNAVVTPSYPSEVFSKYIVTIEYNFDELA